jgi:hypothetical protein
VWCAYSRLCTLSRDLWLSTFANQFDAADKRAAAMAVESSDGPQWRWLEARYLEMDEAARSVGAHFAVLLFPYPAQVVRDGRDPVEEQVLAIARRHAWTVVDPLATFRTANAAGTPLFLDLWHPTTEGHRIAAEATLQRLACTGELGPKARSVCGGGAGARAGG